MNDTNQEDEGIIDLGNAIAATFGPSPIGVIEAQTGLRMFLSGISVDE